MLSFLLALTDAPSVLSGHKLTDAAAVALHCKRSLEVQHG